MGKYLELVRKREMRPDIPDRFEKDRPGSGWAAWVTSPFPGWRAGLPKSGVAFFCGFAPDDFFDPTRRRTRYRWPTGRGQVVLIATAECHVMPPIVHNRFLPRSTANIAGAEGGLAPLDEHPFAAFAPSYRFRNS